MCDMNSTSAAVYGLRMLSARAWAMAAASDSGLSVCAVTTGAVDEVVVERVAVEHAAVNATTAQIPRCGLLILSWRYDVRGIKCPPRRGSAVTTRVLFDTICKGVRERA